MVKDWLIRTKNNHLLGPVTKDKIKQLISNGSIKGDDEICSGNGYWLYIKEQDLVAKYIFTEEKQPFNPVQEMEPVLNLNLLHPSESELEYPDAKPSTALGELDEFGNIMPTDDDLEYPDMVAENTAEISTGSTVVSSGLKTSPSADNVLPQKTSPQRVAPVPKKREPVKVVKGINRIPKKREAVVKPRVVQVYKKTNLTKNILYLFLVIIFLFLIVALYYRKPLLKEYIISGVSSILPNAHAQEAIVPKKKSGFLPQR